MYFKDVVLIFQKIEKERSRTEITKLLAQLFSQATAHEAQIISYLSLGLLRAPYKGSQFNFAEKNMTKLLAHMFDVSGEEIKKRTREIGDLGSVLLDGTWKVEQPITLLNLYKELAKFEKISGVGSQDEKNKHLLQIFYKIDPLSACYVARIIIGKLRLGFSDMTLIDALSWSQEGNKSLSAHIEHAYNISADIGLIAHVLKEKGMKGIESIAITVGIPIRPAAAERLDSASEIIKKIGPCIAQPKMDGFRLQVHMHKSKTSTEVWFFSRNLLDMSAMFPDLVKDIQQLDVEDIIVEGEALAYDEETEAYLPFQETVKRRRKHDIEEMVQNRPLKLVLFDILYLNGISLLDYEQQQRMNILSDVLSKHPMLTSITLVPGLYIATDKDLEGYFMSMVAAGLEGIMAKRPHAHYQPGKRNFNWIKLKRHEGAHSHLEDTLDVVILGYYYGKGKRATFGIGAFLVAVYNKKDDRFETVAKIGTGLSDEGWQKLRKMCDMHVIAAPLINMHVEKALTPDVWVEPKIVVEVLADEITRSPIHTAGKTAHETGFALRFPRFMGYRLDKSPQEATTITELLHLFNDQKK